MSTDSCISITDIISNVVEGDNPPFRPSVPDTNSESMDLMQLMQDCCKEKPHDRPDFNTIKKRYADMSTGKYVTN